jgi:group II intron reverse transcriptase/maturase
MLYYYTKAIYNIISIFSILLTKGHSYEEDKIVQTAKGVAPNSTIDIQKKLNMGTGDRTAEPERIRKNGSSKINNEEKLKSKGTKEPKLTKIPKKPRKSKEPNIQKKSKESKDNKNSSDKDGNNKNLVKNSNFFLSTLSEKISKSSSEEELCRVIRKMLDKFRSRDGKLNGIIRIIANPVFLFECYKLIKCKPGNMSPGSIPETLDGINEDWFRVTAKDLKEGRYQFKPTRQILIPNAKSNSFRPINIGSPRDKIVQKALHILFNAIFDEMFLPTSHGYRPGKSVHSALDSLHFRGNPFVWVIQGDIQKCFDSMPHGIILSMVKSKISCTRTLTLIERTLKVGYIQSNNKWIKSIVGIPQGNILSPLLANIVLHQLDVYIQEELGKLYNLGEKRKRNKEYAKYTDIRRKTNMDKYTKEERTEALKKLRKIPKLDMHDPDYKRIMYVRYADDFVILLVGTLKDAEKIRSMIKEFLLNQCGLMEKTIITRLRDGFHFLGAFCFKEDNNSIFNQSKNQLKVKITRRATLRLRVDAPIKVLVQKLINYGFARRNKKGKVLAKGITHMVHQDHFTIVKYFNSKIRGILNFYSFAGNRSLLHRVFSILRQSCALTLARKFKLRTMRKAFSKFGFDLRDSETDMKLTIPNSLKRISDFKIKRSSTSRSSIICILSC